MRAYYSLNEILYKNDSNQQLVAKQYLKIICHCKHNGKRDKEEKNADYGIEAALGVMFHHGFSATVVYPFNPAESDKENKTAYDNLCWYCVSRENPQGQKHQRHDD